MSEIPWSIVCFFEHLRERKSPTDILEPYICIGGAELLFNKTKKHEVMLPESEEVWTVGTLLPWMRDTMLQERPELFMQGNTVRPGILVLINDTDWELKGELEYEIKANDTIVFISTLHGG